MNIFKRLFHRHNYKTLISKLQKIEVTYFYGESVTGKESPKTGVIVIRRCEECGDEEAFITDGQAISYINVDYAKTILDIKNNL